ncbi:MAG TPA: MerR family transcriptional regulator [Bacteroidota bacterium]|nr:MerR family transcriptional regulator [Bacteroidota bacterium]
MKREAQHTAMYSIGEAAKKLDVSVQLLRLYEERGLIIIQKSDGNQRMYTDDDLERIRCIREAINEQKISMEGIRRIHSLIPCWEMIHCPVKKRKDCPAYGSHKAGCWTYEHTNTDCALRDCRACKVYQYSSECKNIKPLIQRSLSTS